VDKLTVSERSANMAKVRGENTQPEIALRRIAHRIGLRYRLHRKDLPGKPDAVLPKHKLAVFVHGCFWHRHPGCHRASMPSSKVDFWAEKFRRTVERDARQMDELAALGWKPMVVWECELRDEKAVEERLLSATSYKR
jgi:DNA mismatch endonuclease (patch repair protein)